MEATRRAHWKLVAALVALTLTTITTSRADVVYTYTTNPLNPLYDNLPEDNGTIPDNFSISFSLLSPLAANSTYDISVQPSATDVLSWQASDTRFGETITGIDAPISLVPPPDPFDGVTLNTCGGVENCFGGMLQTDGFGNIVQWALLANVDLPIFITFYETGNQSQDGASDLCCVNGKIIASHNMLNGPIGTWTENGLAQPQLPNIIPALRNTTPVPATLPLFATGLGLMGLFGRRRKWKAHAVRGQEFIAQRSLNCRRIDANDGTALTAAVSPRNSRSWHSFQGLYFYVGGAQIQFKIIRQQSKPASQNK